MFLVERASLALGLLFALEDGGSRLVEHGCLQQVDPLLPLVSSKHDLAPRIEAGIVAAYQHANFEKTPPFRREKYRVPALALSLDPLGVNPNRTFHLETTAADYFEKAEYFGAFQLVDLVRNVERLSDGLVPKSARQPLELRDCNRTESHCPISNPLLP